MDLSKIGDAFQGAANVAAGGLMDRYQRKRDLEEWQKKQDYAQSNQNAELDKRFQEAERIRAEQDFRDSLKKDVEMSPELQPFVQRHLQGDPEASKVLSVYMGSKYKTFKDTPLSSDELAELAPLPPGVRHNIIQGHLTVLRKRADEDLTRKTKEKTMEYQDARIKALEKEKAAPVEDEPNLYDYTEKKKEAAQAKKANVTEVKQIRGKVEGLNSRINTQRVALERASKNSKDEAVAAQIQANIDESEMLRDEYLNQLEQIAPPQGAEAEFQAKWSAESAKARPFNDFLTAQTPEDRKELNALRAAKPGLDDEQIINIFSLWKQQEKIKSSASKSLAAGSMKSGLGR